MMRVTPKISDSPAATRNRPEAVDSPLRAWKRKAEGVIGFYPSPEGGGWLRAKRADGWGFIESIPPPGPLRGPPSPKTGRDKNYQFDSAGRSFLTSASDGSTEAPSTYLKSTMVPLPFSSASL